MIYPADRQINRILVKIVSIETGKSLSSLYNYKNKIIIYTKGLALIRNKEYF